MKTSKLYKLHELFKKHAWRVAYAVPWNGTKAGEVMVCSCGAYTESLTLEKSSWSGAITFPRGYTEAYIRRCVEVAPPRHKAGVMAAVLRCYPGLTQENWWPKT
jgi:hypothetical protein